MLNVSCLACILSKLHNVACRFSRKISLLCAPLLSSDLDPQSDVPRFVHFSNRFSLNFIVAQMQQEKRFACCRISL